MVATFHYRNIITAFCNHTCHNSTKIAPTIKCYEYVFHNTARHVIITKSSTPDLAGVVRVFLYMSGSIRPRYHFKQYVHFTKPTEPTS